MMTQRHTRIRHAAALLLTAAALPSTPLLAQDTQATVPAPVVDTAPPLPIPAETPAPVVTPAPTVTAPAPTATAPAEPAPQTTTQRQTPRTTTRTTARAPARATQAPTPAASPAPAAPAPAPAVEVPAPAAEAVPPPVALPTAPAAEPPAAPAEQGGRSILPWAIAGLLALGALAFFLLRRRPTRTDDEPVRATERATVFEEPAPAAVAPVAAAAVVDEGRPEIDLDLRPRRAGVTGDEAVVEFELALGNRGSAPARDVRVSTWMVAAGQATEMESALIERRDEASLPQIEAGTSGHMAGAVTLTTRGLAGDAVLPVVVAEARYTLPDGSEGRTHATYAVGVPDGEELAHFAIDNPSGLHDDVVARELGEAETV